MNPAALGLASHVLAGLSPFIVAAAIARVGLLPATAWIYSAGSVVLLWALVSARARAALTRETRALWNGPARPLLVGSLAGFLIAGVAYYQGLTRSPRVAEYVFLTRLDWLVQAPVAILVLKEPWTRAGLGGAALALAGGVVLAWTGAIGASGLVAAGVYILASLAGYLCASPITRSRGVTGAATLTAWRHWVNTAGFVALAMIAGPLWPLPRDPATLALIAVGALVLIGLFLLRFASLTRMPVWVLSAQAPVQALVAVTASLLTEGRLPPITALAIAMIVGGEVIVAGRHWQATTRPGTAGG